MPAICAARGAGTCELGGLALVFAEASGCRAEWELGLKGWNVRESMVVNGWKAEGRAEGRTEGRAEALLAVLEEKFGSVPQDLVDTVRATTDADKLRQWVGAAVRAETLEAFRAAIGG
ncbi:Uncharacterized protein OS=Lachnospiraceae bacterium A4 GN=C804_02285 PE=4 SV=1 [Gemmata massiliana]|uniref:Uncharacterized protein n=1 Tax=Gemmata massiliana TaxID=1210884 RepID=A0A6P2CVP4_9BACT|nr:hypothetical protein [Gemmata massiliana]VTR92973.1 Uncharacterized protein OS=Lachnospiraceae bacterium A4 GN=C804_02285 PE=4 SV=1 [Gemmata massiliana]